VCPGQAGDLQRDCQGLPGMVKGRMDAWLHALTLWGGREGERPEELAHFCKAEWSKGLGLSQDTKDTDKGRTKGAREQHQEWRLSSQRAIC
jgi:hypothetical protein